MSEPGLYDTDFVLWTEQQAQALRRLPRGSNELDIEHLAEEIESLGQRDVREVTSLIRNIMEHALKLWREPGSRDAGHWRGEILEWQAQIEQAYAPSMRQRIELSRQWDRAVLQVRQRLGFDAAADVAAAMTECPFELDDLITSSFDLDSFLAKLPAAAHP